MVVPDSTAQDPEKMQVLNNLRRRLIADIGDPSGNPNDPDYFDRWEKA
jgi:hypothetical protein